MPPPRTQGCFAAGQTVVLAPIVRRLLMPMHIRHWFCLLLLALGVAGCNRNPSGAANSSATPSGQPSEEFLSLMNAGRNYYTQGDATNALAIYRKAQAIAPSDVDLRLNIANSYLLSGAETEAIRAADDVLKLDPNSAAAYFIKGSAYLRLGNAEEALKALENSKQIDPGEIGTFFQLGRARSALKQWDGAIAAFQEGLRMDPRHLHSTIHYLLAQALLRAGRQAEADRELDLHAANVEGGGAVSDATFERSKYTVARVPFKLEQPEPQGARVKFVDATQSTLGNAATNFSGPLGVLDVNHSGWNSLFALEKGDAFRVLWNSNGHFRPLETRYAATPSAKYSKVLVGDLQNDRFDDVVVLGDRGTRVFKFATNGLATDVSAASPLTDASMSDGVLMDLDFTGKLDLLAVSAGANLVQTYRQFGPLQFSNITSNTGIPASLQNAQRLEMEDWNRDGIMDVLVSRQGAPPLLLEKQRGGRLVPNEPTNWVAGTVFCTGDFDNDLRPDLAVVSEGKITLCYNGGSRKEVAFPGAAGCRQLVAVDYDNDGWLDLWAAGETIRAWRNLGLAGFRDETATLGLEDFNGGPIAEIRFADFDLDCDSDVIVALANGGLRYLRNDGANANTQLKVRLFGTRSNASGLGCKIEIESGGLRALRTVQRLPVEVGVGKYQKLDSFLVHWFNWPQGIADVAVNCKEPLFAPELSIQEGSCPYLYTWDGTRFRFVTDILGAAPLGLPVAERRYIEADPEEYVWLGTEQTFPPRDGQYQIRITEELREVLYLDEAKLVVVDHEPGTEVHPTDKLLPGKPFPPGKLLTLHHEHPLQAAQTLDGQDVTSTLKALDGRRVSPPSLRIPQLRGLAEPHGIILDFGPLNIQQPLVLVMNGWLRFGGGMANIAASHDASLPFPFPLLEAEVAPGIWKTVDVTVGAPAGKTKTILVELDGKLEPGTRRLRMTEAFEIYWDRIALMEKATNANTTITFVSPVVADLHFRGFSSLQPLAPDSPLTPDYASVGPNSYWTVTPGGWCTRFGDVRELVATRDEGLVIMNGGDELSLNFAANSLPAKLAGSIRQFFLYADGWDKDSDFHVATGTQVEPLPFHGLSDQDYGREERPPFASDALHRKYNTRWVEGRVLKQTVRR